MTCWHRPVDRQLRSRPGLVSFGPGHGLHCRRFATPVDGCLAAHRHMRQLGPPLVLWLGVAGVIAVAYGNGTVKRSKIRHIDARQDWVGVMRGSSACKLWKVNTKTTSPTCSLRSTRPTSLSGCATDAWCSGRFRRSNLLMPAPSKYKCTAPAAEEATRTLCPWVANSESELSGTYLVVESRVQM